MRAVRMSPPAVVAYSAAAVLIEVVAYVFLAACLGDRVLTLWPVGAAVLAYVIFRTARVTLIVSTAHVTVRNRLRTVTFSRSQLDQIGLAKGGPFGSHLNGASEIIEFKLTSGARVKVVASYSQNCAALLDSLGLTLSSNPD